MTRKTYELPLNPIPMERFTFIKAGDGCDPAHKFMLGKLAATNLLVAEASDLGPGFRIERLFNDACDEGIAIRSNRTAKVVRFTLSKIQRQDGDIVAWHFIPFDAVAKPVNVTIFND